VRKRSKLTFFVVRSSGNTDELVWCLSKNLANAARVAIIFWMSLNHFIRKTSKQIMYFFSATRQKFLEIEF